MQLTSGQIAPPVSATDLAQHEIQIPDSTERVTHLQFRRFAGCPVCNVHLQTFVKRHTELEHAGLREVTVFHSPQEKFLPYQSHYPFEIICDPKKDLYRKFGVRSSIKSIFSLSTWKAAFQGMRMPGQPMYVPPPEGGRLGLPADFLIAPNGQLIAVHYGRHAFDQWTVDEVLDKVRHWQQATHTSKHEDGRA